MAAGGEDADIFNKRFPLEEEAEMLSEEEGEYERKRQECIDKGMVEFDGWRDKIQELYPDWPEGSSPFEALMSAAKATCLVVRKSGSEERYWYHYMMEREASLSAEERKTHYYMAQKRFKTPACGTGFLFFVALKSAFIMTNNHVIMNDEEAEDAEVYFDYDEDGQLDEAKKFEIKRLMFTAPRTDHEEDYSKLDFSIMEVKWEDEEQFQFLAGHCYKINSKLQAGSFYLDPSLLVMISHPHGLGKRLSWTREVEFIGNLSHVKHDLATAPGSSGSVLLQFGMTPNGYGSHLIQSVHYRSQRAVTWDRISFSFTPDLELGERQWDQDLLNSPDPLRSNVSRMEECKARKYRNYWREVLATWLEMEKIKREFNDCTTSNMSRAEKEKLAQLEQMDQNDLADTLVRSDFGKYMKYMLDPMFWRMWNLSDADMTLIIVRFKLGRDFYVALYRAAARVQEV